MFATWPRCSTSPARRICRVRRSAWWERNRCRCRASAPSTWWIGSPEDIGGAEDSRVGGGQRARRARAGTGPLRLLGNLSVEIDHVSREQSRRECRARGDLGKGAGGDEVRVACDGQMRLESEERPLGGEVRLPLLAP